MRLLDPCKADTALCMTLTKPQLQPVTNSFQQMHHARILTFRRHAATHTLLSVMAAAATLQLKLPSAEAEISPPRIGRLGRRALFGRTASDVIPPGAAVAAAAAAVVDAYERQAALQVCGMSRQLG